MSATTLLPQDFYVQSAGIVVLGRKALAKANGIWHELPCQCEAWEHVVMGVPVCKTVPAGLLERLVRQVGQRRTNLYPFMVTVKGKRVQVPLYMEGHGSFYLAAPLGLPQGALVRKCSARLDRELSAALTDTGYIQRVPEVEALMHNRQRTNRDVTRWLAGF